MAVLRLLDKSQATLGLSELGLLPDSLAKLESMLKVPFGMILISGPTGAGKTTTLYAAINSLDTTGRNVVTIEDPAEYRFKDINQIQVNPAAGITFARGLRSILRLDPDVVLVGEIRDAETANIAIQAALTGHLMLSSIHASDTTGVLFRLLDLEVESFLIASSVIGIVAQRMVRRICPHCNQLVEAHLVERMAYEKEIGEQKTHFLYGTGCKTCSGTGYLGRIGIFEIMVISDNIRLEASRGNITLSKASCDSLKLESSRGNINVSESTADIANLSSSRGHVTYQNVTTSDLTANSSRGNINIAYSPSATGEIIADITASRGDVSFVAPPSFSGQVELTASRGSIKTDLPITVQGQINEERIKGTIGRGKGRLRLKTGRGSIRIR